MKRRPSRPPSFLPKGKNRPELFAARQDDVRSQPVSRSRREALRRELVVARWHQLPLLGGTSGAGDAQRSLHFFRPERRPALVFDVKGGGALLHDQFDGDLVV